MATRSQIGLKFDDGTVLSVYHHWDGYPEALGAKLAQCYTTKEQVADLIDGGSISTIMAKSGWDGTPFKQETVLYYSERGDQDTEPEQLESVDEFYIYTRRCDGEFAYLFDQVTNAWSCYNTGSDEFVDLYPELAYA
jgi:hypothetical protein